MNLTEHGPVHYRYSTVACGDTISVYREQFYVVKETPSGYWVVPSWCIPLPAGDSDAAKRSRRWVSKTSRKRYCYPTPEEAWESYQARRAWRVHHLERQLRVARVAETLAAPTDRASVEEDIFEGML